MKNGSANVIMQNPPMSRKDKNPSGAKKSTMGDDRCSDEVISPKPRIMREPRIKIMRTVTFTEPSPNKSIALVQSDDRGTMTDLDNVKVEKLNKDVSRLDKLVKSGLVKRKQDNMKHEKVVGYITGHRITWNLLLKTWNSSLRLRESLKRNSKLSTLE